MNHPVHPTGTFEKMQRYLGRSSCLFQVVVFVGIVVVLSIAVKIVRPESPMTLAFIVILFLAFAVTRTLVGRTHK